MELLRVEERPVEFLALAPGVEVEAGVEEDSENKKRQTKYIK